MKSLEQRLHGMHRSYFSLEPIEVDELFFLLHHVEQSEHDTISHETVFCWKVDRRRFMLSHPKFIELSPERSSLRGALRNPPPLLPLRVMLFLTSLR